MFYMANVELFDEEFNLPELWENSKFEIAAAIVRHLRKRFGRVYRGKRGTFWTGPNTEQEIPRTYVRRLVQAFVLGNRNRRISGIMQEVAAMLPARECAR